MILAIDTSTQWMGIGILDGGLILYEKIWKTNRRHTVELAAAIKAAFQDTDTNPKDLTAVAVAVGPGSFTSLRIGLAAAKGFSLSLKIPIIGIPSLNITANGIPSQDTGLICTLRAGRGRLAVLKYDNENGKWESRGELQVLSAEELEQSITSRTLICGEMDADEQKTLLRRWRNVQIANPAQNVRRPSILANLANDRLSQHDVDDPAAIAPIYLRTVKNVDTITPV